MTLYKKTIGKFGEDLACDFLKKRGYRILERNVKISYQEIDIVSSLKNRLVFVEVKTRSSDNLGGAEDALFPKQIKNLKKAIAAYCHQRQKKLFSISLDFVAIDLNRINKTAKIKHYKNIF